MATPTIEQETKSCSKCGKSKPLSQFNRQVDGPLGYRSQCKICVAKWIRDKRRHDPRWAKDAKLRSVFGITIEDYEALVQSQGGLCAVCYAEQADCVDHDHVTGEVRGLLCRGCNTGIGMLKDNPTLLAAAILYLEKEKVS